MKTGTVIPIQFLIAKSLGFKNSIVNFSQEERLRYLSPSFARDYNRFVDLVGSKYIELQILLPPKAEIKYGHPSNEEFTEQTYAEVLTWSEQINQLLLSMSEGE